MGIVGGGGSGKTGVKNALKITELVPDITTEGADEGSRERLSLQVCAMISLSLCSLSRARGRLLLLSFYLLSFVIFVFAYTSRHVDKGKGVFPVFRMSLGLGFS